MRIPALDPRAHHRQRRRGVAAIEYCLLLSLIAMGCLAGVQALGGATSGVFGQLGGGAQASAPAGGQGSSGSGSPGSGSGGSSGSGSSSGGSKGGGSGSNGGGNKGGGNGNGGGNKGGGGKGSGRGSGS